MCTTDPDGQGDSDEVRLKVKRGPKRKKNVTDDE